MAENADLAIPRQTGAANRPRPAGGDLSGEFESPRDETGQPIAFYGNASSGMLRRLARGWRRPGRWWP